MRACMCVCSLQNHSSGSTENDGGGVLGRAGEHLHCADPPSSLFQGIREMVAPVLKSFQAEVRASSQALGEVGVTCTRLPSLQTTPPQAEI